MEFWLVALIVAVVVCILLLAANLGKKRSASSSAEGSVLTVTIQEKQFDDDIYTAIIAAMHEELNSQVTNYNIISVREL